MYPHRIRLRGPWECEPIDGSAFGGPRRVLMPCGWLEAGLADFHGLARFTRKFGYPGRIDEGEHVWLTCDGCKGVREIRLNGSLLTDRNAPSYAFDVTPLLGPRNRLEVLLLGASDDAGLWGEVALEIRRDAFLGDLLVTASSAGICVTGTAIGTAPRPLELYTLVDSRHVDYRTIQPRPEGEPFRLELPEVTPLSQTVRIDLIDVSTIWHSVELPIARGI